MFRPWLFLIPAGCVRAARQTVRRARLYGFRAAWICLRAHGLNFYIRVRNSAPGQRRVVCPCCGWHGYAFRSFDSGQHIFPQIECPQCGAHDRHRMMHLFMTRSRPPFLRKDHCLLLHFAPEDYTQRLLDAYPSVLTAATDMQPGALASFRGPRFASDIRSMGIRDGAFDAVFCIHVLEHVLEDRQAISEVRRILKPGGTAVIMVPAHLGPETHEWGRPDPLFCYHVRDYSIHDFKRRLEGFQVEEVTPGGLLDAGEREQFQLLDSAIVYCCTKPDSVT